MTDFGAVLLRHKATAAWQGLFVGAGDSKIGLISQALRAGTRFFFWINSALGRFFRGNS